MSVGRAIAVRGIRTKFGTFTALDDISFAIESGEIFGFLGPSGSGKTTMINILTGQLSSDGGQATILGKNSDELSADELEQIGLVGDTSGFYEKMTLYKNLLFYSKFHGVPTSRVDELLQKVGLYGSRNKVAEKLSTGMKQRMFLVRALINQPKVLFLDEPTSGLDPATSRTIHDLILELKAAGTTIFLTTHDMHEATLLCDHLALLHKGRLVEEGNPADLIQKYNTDRKVTLRYMNGNQKIVAFKDLAVTLADQLEELVSIHSCEPTLEDIFISLTGGELNV